MLRNNSLGAYHVVKIFLLISFVTLLALGNSQTVGANTYGISTNAPAVNSNSTINITDPNETRGINYYGTGTVRNYGDITTVTTGGIGNSSGICSIPSASLIYNGGNILHQRPSPMLRVLIPSSP